MFSDLFKLYWSKNVSVRVVSIVVGLQQRTFWFLTSATGQVAWHLYRHSHLTCRRHISQWYPCQNNLLISKYSVRLLIQLTLLSCLFYIIKSELNCRNYLRNVLSVPIGRCSECHFLPYTLQTGNDYSKDNYLTR